MDLKSFFGILPPKLPYAELDAPVETLPIPPKVTLLWSEGTTTDLSISEGGNVKTGQELARNGNALFVSTVTGQVQEIKTFPGADGNEYVAVAINANPRDSFDPSLKVINEFSKAQPSELRSAINRAGFSVWGSILGDPSTLPPIHTLIISALDMDPMSVANQQAFRDNAGNLGPVIQMLARSTQATRSVLALPDHLIDISIDLSESIESFVKVEAVYPNGLPDVLAKKFGAGLLMKARNGGVVGNTLVISVEHAVAMVECLQSGKPFIEKIVTFSAGKDDPLKNFRVRIGTPIGEILKKTGVEPQPNGKLILNGTMRGYACFSDEQPVSSNIDSIHIQEPKEIFFFENTACVNCGKCNAICPVDLEVNLLGRFSEYGIFEKCRDLGAENCIECGLCAYVCPAHRPLVQFISHSKHVIQTEAIEVMGMEEAMACDACGPICPAIRLFESASKEGNAPMAQIGGKQQE